MNQLRDKYTQKNPALCYHISSKVKRLVQALAIIYRCLKNVMANKQHSCLQLQFNSNLLTLVGIKVTVKDMFWIKSAKTLEFRGIRLDCNCQTSQHFGTFFMIYHILYVNILYVLVQKCSNISSETFLNRQFAHFVVTGI